MQITYVLELLEPTSIKKSIIEKNILQCYQNRISISNNLSEGVDKLSSKDFSENLPSAIINQNIREVKALYKLFKKSNSKKDNLSFKINQPLCYNNQNYRIRNGFVSIPLMTNKSKRYWFPVVKNNRLFELEKHIKDGAKLGKASLFRKKSKYYFAVTITIKKKKLDTANIMGIDIGLNQLAVASVKNDEGKEINRQFHNGKKAGFIRRKYSSLRRRLGKAKKANVIKSIRDKESRCVKDLNHKISRQLIDLAVQERVSTIVMENLKNIRKTAYSQKRADRNLNSWTFYELQQFIEYKANLAGIEVIYIDPKYTSQTCNNCGERKKSNRRRNDYKCACGYRVHSDLNAARNICDKGIKAVYQQSA